MCTCQSCQVKLQRHFQTENTYFLCHGNPLGSWLKAMPLCFGCCCFLPEKGPCPTDRKKSSHTLPGWPLASLLSGNGSTFKFSMLIKQNDNLGMRQVGRFYLVAYLWEYFWNTIEIIIFFLAAFVVAKRLVLVLTCPQFKIIYFSPQCHFSLHYPQCILLPSRKYFWKYYVEMYMNLYKLIKVGY